MPRFTERIRFTLTSMAIMGPESQAFLGAKWVSLVFRLCPKKRKTTVALWMLSLSPHYFYRDADESYRKIGMKEFLKRERKRCDESRKEILRQLLSPYVNTATVAIDYGCGPGFLAKHVSSVAKQTYALDISDGVLECARIINPAPNLTYLNARDVDEKVADNTVDLIFSFAVIQHVTDVIFEDILRMCFKKLKSNGMILFHMPLDDAGWKSEQEWTRDKSMYGKLKWKYGLHCFGRTKEFARSLLEKSGFDAIHIVNIRDVCRGGEDDVFNQQLVSARKP